MAVIATAGHVDHGKSSLVIAVTGTDPDRLREEKQRGMTIDLGFAHTVTSHGVVLSFVDVPGHVDFIRTMIAGVSEVTAVLLVVDAHEGWMPQTSEHCDIAALLGVQDVIVAMTKVDRVVPERITEIQHVIAHNLQMHGLHCLNVVTTSVVTGEGIDTLRDVLEEVVQGQQGQHGTHHRLRLFIDRVFSMTGAGTVVTGTLQGSIQIDQKLVIARNDRDVRVRAIQTYGNDVDTATGPIRCAVNISGVSVEDVERGDVLVEADHWYYTTQCDVRLKVVSSLDHDVSKRGHYILHLGTSDQEVRLRILGGDHIVPGDSGDVRLTFETPLPLVPGDRFVLRETGRGETVGGGVVLDVHPVTSIRHAKPDGTLQTYLDERGWMKVADVEIETGIQCEPIVGEWIAHDRVVAATTKKLHEQLLKTDEGISISVLMPWELLLVQQMDDVVVTHGFARVGDQLSQDEQKVAVVIHDAGVAGEEARLLSRDIVRRLIQRGIVHEHDGRVFHVDVLESLRPTLAKLWQENPQGFSMAQLRDATSLTRKHAVPLGTVLDKVGLTRRREDVRMPGPRWLAE